MKPVLLILAAGMGSRYGGLKQIDPVGPNGEVIIDYSLYDAKKAGFEDVYFIIKHEIEKDFKKIIENGAGKHMNVHYVFQELTDIPEGYSVPEGRIKPWGTAHAIFSARNDINSPFAVINADDYYGPEGFKQIFNYLSQAEEDEKNCGLHRYCMVGYKIKNTVTENGSVARGICEQDNNSFMTKVTERTNIEKKEDGIAYTEDEGKTWVYVNEETLVSMNMFGFTSSVLQEFSMKFPAALDKILKNNPLKGEIYMPTFVSELIEDGKATVKLLPTSDKWYGVTYKEDKPMVITAMREKIAKGLYPEKLW